MPDGLVFRDEAILGRMGSHSIVSYIWGHGQLSVWRHVL